MVDFGSGSSLLLASVTELQFSKIIKIPIKVWCPTSENKLNEEEYVQCVLRAQ